MNTLFFYFFLALGVSFLCSLLESIILSITHSHVAVLAKTGSKSSRLLENMKENINKPLAAILTVNTVANVVGAAGVGAQAMKLFGSEWVAILSGLLTLCILIFSEIIPKTLGTVYWRPLAGPAVYMIRGLIYLTYPFVFLSNYFSEIFASENHQQKVSRQEVVAMAEMGEDEGSIREKESDIIENLFNLNDVVAEDVMTPRSVVFALQKDSTVGDVVGEHTPIAFSRIPIFDKDMDDILGFIHRYDLVNKQAEDQFHIKMKDILEPIHTVKQEDSIASILDEFVRRRQQIFMVIDEFGTTTGLITLEDAIETLLGVEIVDEHDSVVDMRKLATEKFRSKRGKRRES
ncbi:MAG: hemolysin family protein [Candidatus Marinimicrobia bacterium]|nr:hemolysin family protein [Candidatus Neomarinimicrobiota bacterium]